MMPNLQISLLGPWQVRLADQPVTQFPTSKVQALLAYLAVEAGTAHPREALTGLFWAQYRADSARQNLRKTLQRLRQAIPPHYLLATTQTVQFNPASDYRLDVAEFVRLMAACRHHAHGELLACSTCIARLEQAVALYRGDFLTHLFVEESPAFEEWVMLKREWLRSEVLGALYQLAAHHEQRGAYDCAAVYSWRQVEVDPVREEAHQQLMRILARNGQRSAALAAYERCRRILADELNVAPAQSTVQLYEQIRLGQLDQPRGLAYTKAPAADRQLVSLGLAAQSSGWQRLPPKLPAALTTFVGRAQETAAVSALLGPHRLVTLTSFGGAGKTRLALAVARGIQADTFPDGVHWVEFGTLMDAGLIAQTIATTLGLCEQLGQPIEQVLARYLQERRLLLVLDRCELFIQGGAQLIQRLLQSCPGLHILATSRAPLGILGETIYRVPPLSLPPRCQPLVTDETLRAALTQSEAVALFVARARDEVAGFQLTADNAVAVLQLCEQLAGIPLVIEMAAAQLKLLTLTQLSERFAQPLYLLTQTSRTAAADQQSVRTTLDWSYALLNEQERILFSRLTGFTGEFTLAAVEAVCAYNPLTFAEIFGLLSRLVDKSLVAQRRTNDQLPLFHLLAPLRAYGLEKHEDEGGKRLQ